MSEARSPGEVLPSQLVKWRTRRKLSAQGLADRITEDGGSLSRAAISRIEVGKRGVTVDEWLQIAYALAVPPALLLLDLESGEDIAVVPNAHIHPWLAWRWIIGDEAPLTSSNYVKRVEEWARSQTAIQLYQQEQAASTALHKADRELVAAEYSGAPEPAQHAREAQAKALADFGKVFDSMVEHDITPPPLPLQWVDLLRRLQLVKHEGALEVYEPPQVDEP